MEARNAKFQIGQVVRHRKYPFRGVIFDVDPTLHRNLSKWVTALAVLVRMDAP